ncbi:MAG: DNA replication/repair protein RecF, partial [Candidatus Sericytochromatia bacterium]
HLNTNESTKDLTLVFRKNAQKTIKVDGQNVKRMAKLIGNVKIVFFSSEDLFLVKGAPSERRTFIDKILVQVYSGYYQQLQTYNKLIQQRNHTLKEIKESKNYGLADMLSIWDEQIADVSTNIYTLRKDILDHLSSVLSLYHSKISNPNEKVTLKYISSIEGIDFDNWNPDTLKDSILEHLSKKRSAEIARGQSLYGPHRDDINFFINEKEAKTFGSQGQQRTLVLSLKLAEINYIKEKTGETPILLLDDVMAELDHKRQKHLLELVGNNTQTFISTTHLEDFSESWLKSSSVLKISEGQIIRDA